MNVETEVAVRKRRFNMKTHINNLSLRARLMVLICTVFFLVIMGTSVFLYYNAKEMLDMEIAREAQLVAEHNADVISNWFQNIEDEMFLISQISAVRNFEMDEVSALMSDLISERPYYGGILLADRSGTATTVEGLVINIGTRDYFQEALTTGQVFYADPMVTQGTNLTTIMLARPVYDESQRQIVGVLAISVALERLQSIAETMTLDGYGHGWLMSNTGTVVGHPNADYLGNMELFSQAPALQPIAAKMASGDSGLDTYTRDNETRLVAYAPISQNGWSIALEADEGDLAGSITTLRNNSLLIIIVAMVIGFILAYLLARSLANPIINLKKSAEKVASGDLTEIISLDRQDEIGLLASAFNRMVNNLNSIIENVQLTGNKVLDTSRQLSNATEQSGASIEEIAASANHFSQTVTFMNQNVSEMSHSASQINVIASDGEKALERTTSKMEELRGSIQSLSDIVGSLDSSSSEIEKIVQAISAISEQTNLLALNAAIEAARAGDQGRGFAVVADEVRKLSEQSSASTQDIRSLITDIQNKTKQAVEGMKKGVINVDETSKVVTDSSQLLSVIINSINEISSQIQAIGDDTQQIDTGAQEMAAATEEQSATIQEITSSVQDLRKMAEELQSLILGFKTQE